MEGRIIPAAEVTPSELAAWHELASRAIEPNPFLEPECILPGLRHGGVDPDLGLLVACQGGEMYGLVAVRHSTGFARLPRAILTTRPDDDDVPVRPVVGTPLLAAGAGAEAAEAAEAMLRAAARSSHLRRAGLLRLDRLHAGEQVAEEFREAARRMWLPYAEIESWQRCVVPYEPPGGAWERSFNGQRARTLRWRRRRLETALGAELELVDRSASGSLAPAIDDLLRLESSGWKRESGTATACDPQKEAYFRELCECFAAQRRLHLLSLEAGGVSVAINCLVRSGDTLFLAKTAYDNGFAAFGPGVELLMRTVEYARGLTGVRILDLCHGPTDTHYRTLFPDHRRISTLIVAIGGIADRALVRSYPLARTTVRRVRGMSYSLPGRARDDAGGGAAEDASHSRPTRRKARAG